MELMRQWLRQCDDGQQDNRPSQAQQYRLAKVLQGKATTAITSIKKAKNTMSVLK